LSVESLKASQGSSLSDTVLIFAFQPLGAPQQFGYFTPHSFLQKLALDLRIATDAFAAKPIAIRSTAPVDSTADALGLEPDQVAEDLVSAPSQGTPRAR
jgi:hypothetical protein